MNEQTKNEIKEVALRAGLISDASIEGYCLGVQSIIDVIEKNPSLIGATNLYQIQPLKIVAAFMMEQANTLKMNFSEENVSKELTNLVQEKEKENV